MPVPQERDFFESLNTIKQLTESTCQEKWDVLIETALPAAGEALLLLIIPSPEEILENYLHPRTGRKDRKRATTGSGKRQMTRYGQLRWWQKISFPDIDNIIANQLPGREVHAGRRGSKPEEWFWLGIDLVDRVLWYWLLIEVGRTFIVEWGSGIVESRFCTSDFSALFSANGHIEPSGTSNPWWISTGQINVNTNKDWQVGTSGRIARVNQIVKVGGQIAAGISGTLKFDPTPTETTFRILLVTDGGASGQQLHFSNPTTVKEGEPFDLSLTAQVDSFTRLSIQLSTDAGQPSLAIDKRDWTLSLFTQTI